MSSTFHPIKITHITEETNKAKSFVFEIPPHLKEKFQFSAGQYLTMKFDQDGKEERRSYSLSSAPSEKQWRICVKRVDGGKISNHLCDNFSAGDEILISPPEGRFVFKPDPDLQAQYFLFAAGSGITPIMSIAKEILEQEPLSTVYLLYGNTDESQVIYKDELEMMERKYGGQFHLKHAYSDIAEKKGLFGSIFKKSSIELPHFPGQVNKSTIKKFFGIHNMLNAQKTFAYICGPGSMNEDVKKILIKESLLKNNIHFESFGSTADAIEERQNSGETSGLKVELDGEEIILNIDKNTTVLAALVAAGYDPPHSCSSGACSSCMAKLASGNVEMEVTHALDDDDIADGYILTCQARLKSENAHIIYE